MDVYEGTYKRLAKPNLSDQEIDELLRTAQIDFDAARPEPLIELLSSQDRAVRRLGLSIYGWLGAESFPALNAALALIDDESAWSRGYILDGVLSYPQKLDPKQSSIILSIAADPSIVVRHGVAVVIGCLDYEVLELAVSLLSALSNWSEYEQGLTLNRLGPDSLALLLKIAFADHSVSSTFALGAIDRFARSGQIDQLPVYKDESIHADLLLGNANRLINRRKWVRRPSALS
jgi:hypothetical protein